MTMSDLTTQVTGHPGAVPGGATAPVRREGGKERVSDVAKAAHIDAGGVSPGARATAADAAPAIRGSAPGAQRVSNEELAENVGLLNDLIQNIRRELHFSIDDDTGRTIIKVIDSETDDVIRQIPPDEVLSVIEQLEQSTGGLMAGMRA